jgi:hypothetical protein
LAASVKAILGLAQIAAGAHRDGLASTAEALSQAVKSGSRLLIAETGLAHAEALLAAGEARQSLEEAVAAQDWFARAGNQEAEWRCWLLAGRAKAALEGPAQARPYAQEAADVLAGLPQKWDPDSYKTYLTRPDVQNCRNQVDRLAAGK